MLKHILQARALDLQLLEEPNVLPRGVHARSGFLNYHEHAGDAPVIVANRTVSVGPVNIFDTAISLDRHELIFVPCRFASCENTFDLRTDDRPDFVPVLTAFRAKGDNVAPARAEARLVSVVVYLDEIRPPPEEHRVAGGKHRTDNGPQTSRPLFNRAKRRRGPIEFPASLRHYAVAREHLIDQGHSV